MEQQTHWLSPAALFADFEKNGFILRDPATRPNELLRTARAVGGCLYPLIVAGDVVYIDEAQPPQHGDIAYFSWPAEVVEQWNGSERAAEWAKRWGSVDHTRALKLFWRFPEGVPDWVASNYLLTNEDSRAIRGHELHGRVVAIERGGRLLSGDIVHRPVSVAGIDPTAATTTLSTTFSGVSVPNSSVGAYTNIASLTVGPFSTATTVVLTASGQWAQISNYAGSGTWLISTVSGTSGTNIGQAAAGYLSTAGVGGPLALEISVSLAANTTQQYWLNGIGSGHVGDGYSATGTFKAEAIKR